MRRSVETGAESGSSAEVGFRGGGYHESCVVGGGEGGAAEVHHLCRGGGALHYSCMSHMH